MARAIEPLDERHKVTFPCHAELARSLHKGLIKKGFDLASCAVFKPVGRAAHGVSHMVAYPVPTLIPRLDIPIVPIFMNEYFPPLPTAERCYNLGMALAQILAEYPQARCHLRLWRLIARSFRTTRRLD